MMEMLTAMTYRNGGTTYVDLLDNDQRVRYQIDFSLPWDGRPRTVSKMLAEGEPVELEIGSSEEREVCSAIYDLAVKKYGVKVVNKFLDTGEGKPKGVGSWFYVFNFIKIAYGEGKLKI